MKRNRRIVWLAAGHLALIVVLIATLLVGISETAYATEFRGGSTVVIGADEVIDDNLFVSGAVVEINGTATRNLFTTGTSVTVNEKVDGSLFTAGQPLAAIGAVDGSVYVGGYAFALGPDAHVGSNLYFGGLA